MKALDKRVGVLGFAAALIPVVVLSSQQTPSGPLPQQKASLVASRSCWPPQPEDIVNLDSCNDPAGVGGEGCNISMVPDQLHTIYTVPADKWLVVTNFEEQTNSTVGGDARMQLLEVNGGTTTTKRGHDFSGKGGGSDATKEGSYVSPVGLVFAPASDVVIRRTSDAAIPSVALNYTLTGYLVDTTE